MHGIFAMHYRVPEFSIGGDQLTFMQHAHVARRVLEIGKWLAHGYKGPGAVRAWHRATACDPSPRSPAATFPVTLGHTTYQIYYETVGTGRDVLCMHTAGSDEAGSSMG